MNTRTRSYFKRPLVIVCLVGVSLIAGYFLFTALNDNAKFRTKPADQDTPAQVFKKLITSIRDHDYKTFDGCILQGRKATKPFFEAIEKAAVVREKLEATFGEDAWERFNKIPSVSGVTMNYSNMCQDYDLILSKIDNVKFTIKGDDAVCRTSWNGRVERFHRHANGAWYCDMKGNTKGAAVLWNGIKIFMDAVLKNVDKKDITLEQLKYRAQKAEKAYFSKALKKSKNRQ